MKRKRQLLVLVLMGLVFLTACGREAINGDSTGLWNQFVYFFANMIKALSLNGVVAIGIILFTILIRVLMIPIYNLQTKSTQKMQNIQPEIKMIQARYPDKDMDSRIAMNEEIQALYKEHGVNPLMNLIPIFVQLPVLWALFQALTRVDFLKSGHFLWFDIANPDPYFILPILAAGFTFLSMWLSNKALKEKNSMMTTMMFAMPAMIFVFGLSMASGVALYWTVSNAFQVVQLLVFNNPYKIIAERERLEALEKEKEAKIRRAKKKALKKR
ncbi:YidC/Oxa1 family membrane protein insertase [Streptococcus fryi]